MLFRDKVGGKAPWKEAAASPKQDGEERDQANLTKGHIGCMDRRQALDFIFRLELLDHRQQLNQSNRFFKEELGASPQHLPNHGIFRHG
jgi:hypothetical protein